MDQSALCDSHKAAQQAANQLKTINPVDTVGSSDAVDRIFQPLEAYRVDHTGSELDMYRVTKVQFTRMKEEIRALLKRKA
jgi:hypothetical protein